MSPLILSSVLTCFILFTTIFVVFYLHVCVVRLNNILFIVMKANGDLLDCTFECIYSLRIPIEPTTHQWYLHEKENIYSHTMLTKLPKHVWHTPFNDIVFPHMQEIYHISWTSSKFHKLSR